MPWWLYLIIGVAVIVLAFTFLPYIIAAVMGSLYSAGVRYAVWKCKTAYASGCNEMTLEYLPDDEGGFQDALKKAGFSGEYRRLSGPTDQFYVVDLT